MALNLELDHTGSLPIYEDFENDLEGFWTTSSTGQGRSPRTTANGPWAGSSHLVMDSQAGFARNELTAKLDLSGATGVQIRYGAKEFDDEPYSVGTDQFTGNAGFDGIAISEDGVNWYVIRYFTTNSSWQDFFIDLDTEVTALGLSYDSDFYIRFNQYDDEAVPSDGIALDNISITRQSDRDVPGQLVFEDSSGSALRTGVLLDLGAAHTGTSVPPESIVIRNIGAGPVHDISLSHGNPTVFPIISAPLPRLSPGESTGFSFGRIPDSPGATEATITVNSQAPAATTFSLPLRVFGTITMPDWRQQYFGTTMNSGNGANGADPNGDGLTNLGAYALGLNPNEPGSFQAEMTEMAQSSFHGTYTRYAGAVQEGIQFVIQWSDDLSGTWHETGTSQSVVGRSNGMETVRFTVPVGVNGRRFARVVIRE